MSIIQYTAITVPPRRTYFMDLPREIRDQIYGYLDPNHMWTFVPLHDAREPAPVLLVCKAFYQEIPPVWYEKRQLDILLSHKHRLFFDGCHAPGCYGVADNSTSCVPYMELRSGKKVFNFEQLCFRRPRHVPTAIFNRFRHISVSLVIAFCDQDYDMEEHEKKYRDWNLELLLCSRRLASALSNQKDLKSFSVNLQIEFEALTSCEAHLRSHVLNALQPFRELLRGVSFKYEWLRMDADLLYIDQPEWDRLFEILDDLEDGLEGDLEEMKALIEDKGPKKRCLM